MIAVADDTVKYFRAHRDYFWHWAGKGTLVEWGNGTTICYRDDLLTLLRQVNTNGLPSLSTILLVLAACKGHLGTKEIFFLSRPLASFYVSYSEEENKALKETLDDAIKFLKIISDLPENLRTGQKRIHLINELFSGGNFVIVDRPLQNAIQQLGTGRFDNTVFDLAAEPVSAKEYSNHLIYFKEALKKYPTVQHLVIKLRTGLDQLPGQATIEFPDASPLNIFDQLLQDPKTVGLAKLAKRLVATLNIPMQSKGSGDQPFGGISDISNRGNYDKLLLSELAYDDELLMARLVNNEALYFKREQPPEQPKTKRIILMDATLKMWGVSRVFALAAGLAGAQTNKHAELGGAYSLMGENYIPVNINSKAGIIQALEILDHALHCGKALEAVIQENASNSNTEIIFITDEKLMHSAAFHASLSTVRKYLNFVITVRNNGAINLFEYTNGISKQIGGALIDVDELLSGNTSKPLKLKRINEAAPLFLSYNPSPLNYVAIRIKISPEKTFVKEGFGAVAINEGQRVFFVNEPNKGMQEIINYIEKGIYSIALAGNGIINILVLNMQSGLTRLYKANTNNFETVSIDLSGEIASPKSAFFDHGCFYIEAEQGYYAYDTIAEKLLKNAKPAFTNFVRRRTMEELRELINQARPLFDVRAIFYKVHKMYINSRSQLAIGNHFFEKIGNTSFQFSQERTEAVSRVSAKQQQEVLYLVQNKNVRFNVWLWPDGSEAIIDSRGMLYLKSSDKDLPEITIVMVTDRTTACWASDGVAAGSTYFINDKITKKIHTGEFYDNYIQKYIAQLG